MTTETATQAAEATSRTSTTSTRPAPLDVAQEVRFAVVMYGGVSLAIYINGVAQELLRFVRATAPASHEDSTARELSTGTDGAPQETEWVYRKLSYLLSEPSLLARYREELKGETPPPPGQDIVDRAVMEGTPIRTRFIVDILSGTSAGGINGIYLAKALANDQSIDELKKLWVEEGDIALLINDKASVKNLKLKNQKPPLSLLNSRRMYLKLLAALDGMDGKERPAPQPSPYVDELDLFITATDIEGVPLPLRLSDKVVYERRHRNVFHFKYATADVAGDPRNDFTPAHNPFLAFAARCTSSFPFAFEPMRLCDIDEVLNLNLFPHYRNDENCKAASERWQRYFTENISADAGGAKLEFAKRSFGDGGYLDNKPFSYATETLTRRTASVPVDRKLIYIEPSPEHPEDEPALDEKPDFLKNVKAALTDLPTYETIREDLQRVLERNRLIARVNRLTANIEDDIAEYESTPHEKPARPRLAEGEWNRLTLAEMIEDYGIYYLPYRRLRIFDVTDQMAELIALMVNFDVNSDQFTALRSLIATWREHTYKDALGDAEHTVNSFLYNYDFRYRVRRLNYVRGKIDELHCLESLPPKDGAPSGAARPEPSNKQQTLIGKLKASGLDYLELNEAERREFRTTLRLFKCQLNEEFKRLRVGGRSIRRGARSADAEDAAGRKQAEPGAPSTRRSFAEQLASLKITGDHLQYILGMEWKGAPTSNNGASAPTAQVEPNEPCAQQPFEELARARVERLFKEAAAFGLPANLEQLLERAAAALKDDLADVLRPLSRRCKQLLNPEEEFPGFYDKCRQQVEGGAGRDAKQLQAIRTYLWHYYTHFDDYDQISFPVLYETDVAEADIVEVIRISPEDATSTGKRQKLAGTSLFHFGAFLDRVWRQNDIMWGRLDGAERLITALLPDARDARVRERLIKEAQTTIFLQELKPESRGVLWDLMSKALLRVSSGEKETTSAQHVVTAFKNSSATGKQVEEVRRNILSDEELIKFMSEQYEVDRRLDPKPVLRAMSRSTQVVGEMFEEVANAHRLDGSHLRWIARLGQVFWGLIEVAVPNSILNQLVFHWLKLLYVFEIILLVGSIIFTSDAVQKFALTLLGVTVAVNITVLLLRDLMRLRRGWLRFFVTLFVALVLSLAALGAYDIYKMGWRERLMNKVTEVKRQLRDKLS